MAYTFRMVPNVGSARENHQGISKLSSHTAAPQTASYV